MTPMELVHLYREDHSDCYDTSELDVDPEYNRDTRCHLCRSADMMLNTRAAVLGNRTTFVFSVDEGERQLLLRALAQSAIQSPGFTDALELIALRIDNTTEDGQAEMFRAFIKIMGPEITRRIKK